MFLTHRPTQATIDNFIARSKNLSLSYQPVGIAKTNPSGFNIDEASAVIGCGESAFEQARQALMAWRQFDLGWVDLFPRAAPLDEGTNVAVVARHARLWSLNGCRVVYRLGESESTCGFAYGTLTNHAEIGEEIFEVAMNESEEVTYRIRAVSKPGVVLARIGYPLARHFQAKFRRDSIRVMQRLINEA